MPLRLYSALILCALGIGSGILYVQARVRSSVTRLNSVLEEVMSVSWEHRSEAGGVQTITVTKEPSETIAEFEERVEWAEARWPPNV